MVKRQDSLIFSDHDHGAKHVCWVCAFVVLLAGASEYFGLHAGSDQPERIRDHVAEETGNACRHRVKLETALLPAESLLAPEFDCFVQRKVNCVKKRCTKGCNVIPSKKASHSLLFGDFADRPQVEDVVFLTLYTNRGCDVGNHEQRQGGSLTWICILVLITSKGKQNVTEIRLAMLLASERAVDEIGLDGYLLLLGQGTGWGLTFSLVV